MKLISYHTLTNAAAAAVLAYCRDSRKATAAGCTCYHEEKEDADDDGDNDGQKEEKEDE